MTNEHTFLRIYKRLATGQATEPELRQLYWSLKDRIGEQPEFASWFEKARPDRLGAALAIDAVAHAIHQQGDVPLQKVYPGADYALAKAALDELAGLEKTSEIRKFNRGYFTTLLAQDGLVPIEKQQAGGTTKEAISPAIREYEKLFKAGLASPAEILTLARFSPDNPTYQKAVVEKGLNTEEGEPLVVGGPASVAMVDREGHLITTDALRKAFRKFMDNFRGRNVNVLHSDVQVGWALPAYISKNGGIFASGVDDKQLWLLSELRKDTRVAQRVADEVRKGNLRSYSIAGSATKTQEIAKGNGAKYMQVDELELAEITLCSQGMNQGAMFDMMKSDDGTPSLESVVNSFKSAQVIFPSIGVAVEDGVHPRVIIKADRTSSLTDAIVEQLAQILPKGTPIVVSSAPIGGREIPVYKMSLVPIWLDKQMAGIPSDINFQAAPANSKPRPLTPKPTLKQGGEPVATSAHAAFTQWLQKANKDYPGRDKLLGDEEREKKHRNLLDELGFPEEQKAEDISNPVVETQEDPTVVNEAGEDYDADTTQEDKDELREHGG